MQEGRPRVDPPRSASLGSALPLCLDAPLTPPTALRRPLPFGEYLLLDRIGVGGMAEVWRAQAPRRGGPERLVAIKRILPGLAEDAALLAMFIDEARLGGQLVHPHIARVHGLGQVQGSYFIAMEYLPGKDLRALFERSRRSAEPLPLALVAWCVAQLADGLHFAHRACDAQGRPLHLVHRDVSPQNVVVSYEGEVKVIDFGIAKAAGLAPRAGAGLLEGKSGYMSPEQARGLEPDARSDVFAIGVCLYELLTGTRLFTGESDAAVLEQVREAQVAPPSQRDPRIPAQLDRIVLRALARDVEARYASAAELARDLRRFLAAGGGAPFSRQRLSDYMRAAFAGDLEAEQQRLREYAALTQPFPLPLEEGRGGGRGSQHRAPARRRALAVALQQRSARLEPEAVAQE